MPLYAKRAARGICIGVLVWMAVIAGLLLFGTAPPPPLMAAVTGPFAAIDDAGLPALQRYRARDGADLSFRHYAGSTRGAVLIHGSAGSGVDMHPLALALQQAGFAAIVPDLRGHGGNAPHGDIAYLGQLDDDMSDLMGALRTAHPETRWTLLGFSSGGGFALRLSAEHPQSDDFERVILVSPYLRYNSPSVRQAPSAGSQTSLHDWVAVSVGRIVGLSMLHTVQVHAWDGLPVLQFPVPPHLQSVTNRYSWRLMENFAPHSAYLDDIRGIARPAQVLVGDADQLLDAAALEHEFHTLRSDIPVSILPGVDHAGMVTRADALARLVEVMRGPAPLPSEKALPTARTLPGF